MLNWCSSLFIYSVNKYFLILCLLAVSFSWVSCVPAREALAALCPRISFHGCSYREWPWKADVVSPSGVTDRHSYCHCTTVWTLCTQGSCLVPQPSCECSYHLSLLLSPYITGVGSGNGTGAKVPVFWLLLLLWLVSCPSFLTQSLMSSISMNEIVLTDLVAFK